MEHGLGACVRADGVVDFPEEVCDEGEDGLRELGRRVGGTSWEGNSVEALLCVVMLIYEIIVMMVCTDGRNGIRSVFGVMRTRGIIQASESKEDKPPLGIGSSGNEILNEGPASKLCFT